MRSFALWLTVAACGGTKPTPLVSDVRGKAAPIVTPNDDGGSNTIALAGGYTLRVGFGTKHESSTSEDELDTLHIEVVRDADASIVWQRNGVDAVVGPGFEEAHFARCDEVRALGGGFLWGETSGVRISLSCTTGEDSFRAQEIAVLLELTDAARDPYPPLWVGPADEHTTDYAEGSACLTWTLYTFEVQGSTLLQHITEEERAPEGKAGCATRELTRTARVPIRR